MKLLNIYNGASSYRESIYKLIDKEFDSDWVFGTSLGDIKFMDTSCLSGKVTMVENKALLGGKAVWQTNVVRQLFKKEYTHYILLGEERCLSTWCFLLLSLFFPKKKIFFWSHGTYGKESKFKIMIERLFWSNIDGALLYGNRAKKIMTNLGFDTRNYYVVHNSLAYDKQIVLRKSLQPSKIYYEHFENKNPVLIFIGRLTKVKRLDMAINALDLLNNNGNNYNLVFVGDGSERQSLESLVKSKKLQNQVWFYGSCYDEKINAELVYNADLCVAPGNVGLTAMHTMMFGCPVITHDDFAWQMPEFEAIQPGKTGDFFKYQNINSLADTINKWFRTHSGMREDVRNACYNEIDTQWNPYFQIEVIKKLLK